MNEVCEGAAQSRLLPERSARDDRRVKECALLDDLLTDIARFCLRAGIAETTFDRFAVNDGKLVGRLRRGAELRPKASERITHFISEYAEPPVAEKR